MEREDINLSSAERERPDSCAETPMPDALIASDTEESRDSAVQSGVDSFNSECDVSDGDERFGVESTGEPDESANSAISFEKGSPVDSVAADKRKEHPPESNVRRIARAKFQSLFWFVMVAAFVADQITKALAVFYLGFLHAEHTIASFFAEYFTSVLEFPWRLGDEIYKPPVDVIGDVVQWRLTTNTGAAFSMFKGNPEILALVSAVLITILYILYRRWGLRSKILSIAFGMQIGGALGNFADRARLGEVVDFIATKIPWIENGRFQLIDFPIFNVADACAVVGTAIIGIVLIVRDLAVAKSHKRALFETKLENERLAVFQRRIHPLEPDTYFAAAESAKSPDVVNGEPECASDGAQIEGAYGGAQPENSHNSYENGIVESLSAANSEGIDE